MNGLKMICKLSHHVETDEGDFIPKGAPVQVIGWEENNEHEPAIEVMATADMYCDSDDGISRGLDTGCINDGLFFSVPPESLVFYKCLKVPVTRKEEV
jgi:hypothetical protein